MSDRSGRGGRGGGRGAYYKALYGGGGRGRSRGGGGGGDSGGPENDGPDLSASKRWRGEDNMSSRRVDKLRGSMEDLTHSLKRVDGNSYGAYHDIEGKWSFAPNSYISIDHVQSDPFAPPSKVHVRVPNSFPAGYHVNTSRRTALTDFLHRLFYALCRQAFFDRSSSAGGGGWSGPKGGGLNIDKPCQQVLERSSVRFFPGGPDENGWIEARVTVGLPATGRTILGHQAAEILCARLPQLVDRALNFTSSDVNKDKLRSHVECVEDQDALRKLIVEAGLITFVPNSSVLPRASGDSDEPLRSPEVVPFKSPVSMEIEFELPNRGKIQGMGVRKGIGLIVGGGFHGKSTLLSAISMGVYNHIPGDGRDFVSSDPTTVLLNSEDGRAITNVDISPFINNLPGSKDTKKFTTKDASGSTSMAGSVVEALEMGARVILFDEDSCATNFLIRDRRMQMLVNREAEPITPLIHKIRSMYRDHGCSSILVIGGCGDYCDVADSCVMMDSYVPQDILTRAKEVAAMLPSGVLSEEAPTFGTVATRSLDPSTLLPANSSKVTARDLSSIQLGPESHLRLNGLQQLATASQTRAIAQSLKHLAKKHGKQSFELNKLLIDLDGAWSDERHGGGLDVLGEEGWGPDGFLARPRRFEVGMVINRLRNVHFT